MKNAKTVSAIATAMAISISACSSADSSDESNITLTTMPAPSGFPVWLAENQGFYEENDLNVEEISYFPSGAPMLESGVAGEWDAGYIGGPPGIIGGMRWDMVTAGVQAEESGIHRIYAREGEIDSAAPADSLEDETALLVTGSTGHQVLEECLDDMGTDLGAMQTVSLDMPSLVSTFERGEGRIAQVWDPFLVRMEEGGYEQLCDGGELDLDVFVLFQLHPDFVEENRDAAVRWLEAVYRANTMVEEEPEEIMPLLEQFLDEQGVEIDEASLELAISGREWLSLEEAVEFTDSGRTQEGLEATAEFLHSVGNIDEVPDMDFIDNEILKEALEYRESKTS